MRVQADVTTWHFALISPDSGGWLVEGRDDLGHTFVLSGTDPQTLLDDARQRAREQRADPPNG